MDEQKIQRLMRLKRYEAPRANAAEDFILEFRRRQRVELLRPSLWQAFNERLALLIEEFQVPKMAYVATTALAVMVALFILHSENFDGVHRGAPNSPFSYRTSSGTNQAPSSIIMERAEPISLDINRNDRDDDSVVSPLSYILEKKHAQRRSPLSF